MWTPALVCLVAALWCAAPAPALPPGFTDELVATVSGGPLDTAWTPDGRLLVPTKGGQLRLYSGGSLRPDAALDLSAKLCTNGEQGLVGIAVHPNFAFNHWIYLHYITPKYGTCNESEVNGPVGRLSRFTLSDAGTVDALSEVVLFETGARYRDHHTGGDPKFGKDGLLYVTVGDGGGRTLGWPQSLGRLDGKVLRITDSGAIPAGNPYTGTGTARCNATGVPPSDSPAGTKCQEIYTSGLRNPFRAAMDPDATSTRYRIQDVGQHTWEEVSEGPVAGGNYGWSVREGPCAADSDTDCGPAPAGMTDPVHWYHHGPDGGAATGGAFVPDGLWPAEYDDDYLLADYVFGKIWRLTPAAGCRGCAPPAPPQAIADFADIARVVSLRFGPDGALYYTSREGGVVRRIRYIGAVNRAPSARGTASPTAGLAPLAVAFDGTTSSDPDGDPLGYEWDFDDNGTIDATGATASHTYTVDGTYTARLTVEDGHGASDSTTLRIDVGNRPPVPVVASPAAGATFAVGDAFTLHGGATDPDSGTLPDSALTWEVERVHATHSHPYVPPTVGNDIPLATQAPEDLDAANDSFYRIRLTATDPQGLTATVVRDLLPRKVNLTFQTSPTGLRVNAGGFTLTGPSTVVSWEGYSVPVDAPDQVDSSGNSWTFDSWSDGFSRSHSILTPATSATYTAAFASGDQTLSLTPLEDTWVRADKPTNNYATATTLETDGSPVKHSLLKFDVRGTSGRTIARAKLRLYCNDPSKVGGELRGVASNTWSATSVNWNTAPTHDATVLASLGRVAAGNWYELDASAVVTGDGTYSFKLTSPNSDGVAYTSAEGTAGLRPQLVLTLQGAATPDTTAPQAPTALTATAPSPTRVDLTWAAAVDDRGVTGYDVYRDGTLLASLASTSYSDLSVSPGSEYHYEVVARDAAGNSSPPSSAAVVTTPLVAPPLFADDFETGDLSRWTFASGVTIDGQDVLGGRFSARTTSAGAAVYAYKQLAAPQNELYYRLWFKVDSPLDNSLRFARLRTASGSSIIGFYVSTGGRLGYTNYVASSTSASTAEVSSWLWHELQVRVLIAGASSEVEIWLDSVRVGTLSKTDALGTEPIGRIQFGDSSTGRSFDVVFDDVAASTGFIG